MRDRREELLLHLVDLAQARRHRVERDARGRRSRRLPSHEERLGERAGADGASRAPATRSERVSRLAMNAAPARPSASAAPSATSTPVHVRLSSRRASACAVTAAGVRSCRPATRGCCSTRSACVRRLGLRQRERAPRDRPRRSSSCSWRDDRAVALERRAPRRAAAPRSRRDLSETRAAARAPRARGSRARSTAPRTGDRGARGSAPRGGPGPGTASRTDEAMPEGGDGAGADLAVHRHQVGHGLQAQGTHRDHHGDDEGRGQENLGGEPHSGLDSAGWGLRQTPSAERSDAPGKAVARLDTGRTASRVRIAPQDSPKARRVSLL